MAASWIVLVLLTIGFIAVFVLHLQIKMEFRGNDKKRQEELEQVRFQLDEFRTKLITQQVGLRQQSQKEEQAGSIRWREPEKSGAIAVATMKPGLSLDILTAGSRSSETVVKPETPAETAGVGDEAPQRILPKSHLEFLERLERVTKGAATGQPGHAEPVAS